TITLTTTTTAADCANGLSNTATVSADVDTVPANNSSGAVLITVNCPDVGVVKTANPATLTAGGTAGYSITVTANGTGNSTGVTLTDVLPNAGHTWTVGGADAASCSISAGTLTCSFGTMAPGSTKTITLTTTTTAADCANGLSNTATVSADVDTVPANNSSGAVLITVNCPD